MTDKMVTSTPNGEGVSQETTPAVGTPQGGATNNGQSDADLQAIKAKYERDIANLKSVKDREIQRERDAQAQRQAQLQQQLRDLQMSKMDEGQRKQFEVQIQLEDLQREREALAAQRQQLEEMQAMNQYLAYFTELGVDRNKLPIDQGYEAMYNAGMNEVANLVRSLRQQGTPPTPPATPQPTPATPPEVVTHTKPAATGYTWAQLIEKYGSVDNVFTMVERGQLPGSIIPLDE